MATNKIITRFDRDMDKVKAGEWLEVMEFRKMELIGLKFDLRKAHTEFKARCIQQTIDRLTKEYEQLEAECN